MFETGVSPYVFRIKPSLDRTNVLDDAAAASTILQAAQNVEPHNSRSKFRKVAKLFHKLQVKRNKDVSSYLPIVSSQLFSEVEVPISHISHRFKFRRQGSPPGATPLPHRNTRSAFSGTDVSYMAYSSAGSSSASSSMVPHTRSNSQAFGISFSNVSRSTAGSSIFKRGKVFDINHFSVS